MNDFHTSYIEISKSALAHNYAFLRKFIHKDVQISSVVKGNAYGHGIETFVPLAQACGQHHFSVFSADEASRLLSVCDNKTTILIMGAVDGDALEWAIANDIEFYVFDLDRLKDAATIARKLNKKAKVHIELETGMNRIGFVQKSIPNVIELLKTNTSCLSFMGLCTHYAGAESLANYYRIKKQQTAYETMRKAFAQQHLIPELHHTACSAAALRFPKTQMDMVRLGIVQYGFFPNNEVLIEYLTKRKNSSNPLRRLISWKSRVMDVKFVKAGEYVGYGNSYLANANMVVAIVPVGYSHGYSRVLSNQGRMLVHGQRVSVVGTINMNMATIDVTNISDIQKGDEVVLIGRQGDLEISVSSFSEISDQVNYELLTRLPMDLPRIIVE